MKIVVDASVTVKWFLRDAADEDHVPQAVDLLHAIGDGRFQALQPPHWLAEFAAVLIRRYPQAAQSAMELLVAMNFPIVTDLTCYRRAVELAQSCQHHLFDTLYHATALESGATLVTADRRYWHKARDLGRITLLEAFAT